MSQLVKITDRPPLSLAERALQSVRAYWTGEYSLKDPALNRLFSVGSRTLSGPVVNEHTAFMCSAVWAAVSQIAGDIASLPLVLYKREDDESQRPYRESKLFRILHDEANDYTTAAVFRRTLLTHALISGNGYAEIERDGLNRPSALKIIAPHRVEPIVDDNPVGNGRSRERVRYRIDGGDVTLDAKDVLHIQGIGWDGLSGFNMVQIAREAIALARASEQFAAAFFGHGMKFGGVLTAEDRDLDPDQADEIMKKVEELHGRADKAFRLLVLGAGFKFQETGGVKPNEAQMKEIRDQQIYEVARFFIIPPHKLMQLDRSTNNNIEHQGQEYVMYTLLRWIKPLEQELNRKLISPLERNRFYCEHVLEGLLRGDSQGRAEFYSKLFSIGAITQNEIRKRENLNPVEGGDTTYVPMNNLVPTARVNEMIDAQIAQMDRAENPTAAPPDNPPPSNDDEAVRALRARLDAADQLAREAETNAGQLRERIAALEAGGVAKDDEIARLVAAETLSLTTAATAREAESQVRAELAALAAEKAAADSARATAEQDAATARQEAATTAQQAQDAATRATEAQAAAEAARATAAELETALEALREAEGDVSAGWRVALEDAQNARQQAETLESERVRLAAEAQTALELAATAERQAREAQQALDEVTASWQAETDARRQAEAAQRMAEAERERIAQQAEVATTDAATARAEAIAHQETLEALNHQLAVMQAALDARDASHAGTLAELRAAAEASQQALNDALAVQVELDTRASDAEQAKQVAELALAEHRQQAKAQRIATMATRRGLFVDALGRMARREAEQARRHQATPEKLRRWLNQFAQLHEAICIEALLPTMRAHLAYRADPGDPAEATAALVRAHLAAFDAALRDVLDSPPEEFHAHLDRVLARWETDQASRVADRLLTEEIRDVGTE